jgi:site-specific DNA-methyltransferase (adenine-specific)/adenine-specific DNA-methyltransferase
MSKDNPEAFETFEFDLPPIRGFPELRWAGKRPFKSTQYFPAQKKESYGDPTDGWWNRIYWGDNLQVMSHMLREFRGKIDLIYIDPPFDSGADFKKTIRHKGANKKSDYSTFEEYQYQDIWNNDNYLQFIMDRLVLCRDLLSENGSLLLHCDYRRSHYIRAVAEEIFGANSLQSEICWKRTTARSEGVDFNHIHDTIFFLPKSKNYKFHVKYIPYSEDYLKSNFKAGLDGRLFRESPITAPGLRTGQSGAPWKGLNPSDIGKGRHWSIPNFLKHLLSPQASKDSIKALDELEAHGRIVWAKDGEGRPNAIQFADELEGVEIQSIWTDVPAVTGNSAEDQNYPTQKPERLLSRLIESLTDEGDLVFDAFMGSGTTQAVAMKLGRKFIGSDINLGAIETSIKRLNSVRSELGSGQNDLFSGEDDSKPQNFFTGFEVYNVNNYDLFRNPVEAKGLIREAMELQPLPPSSAFDGQREGYLVKIMPVNRIATRQDLNEVINGLDFKAFERRQAETPNKPVERIHLVCMGHEPDLGPALQKEAKPFDIEVMVTDLIRDKAHLHFKKASDARLAIENGELIIKGFYPMNLLQKLSLESDAVEDWRQLVESVKVDFHYDGAVLTPAIVDAPGKDELVTGRYAIPADAATIRVKITDLLSESWEGDIENG